MSTLANSRLLRPHEGHHVGTQSRQEMMSLYGCLDICSKKFLDVTLMMARPEIPA